MTFTIFLVIITIFSIVVHEVAHGLVAYAYGDKTAYHAGRLTMNPLPHIDPFGSVLLPFLSAVMGWGIFGWAKPVPVAMGIIASKTGRILVSLAGIIANLVLAIILIKLYTIYNIGSTQELAKLAQSAAYINVSLALFNLLPIPPFDGAHVWDELFPRARIVRRFTESPLWMIAAIIIGSVIFSYIAGPFVFFFTKLFA